MTTLIQASPAKLKSGDWGAKIQGSVAEGDTIKITTKAGKSWEATVSKVVWSGNGVTLVATATAKKSSGGRSSYGKALPDLYSDDA